MSGWAGIGYGPGFDSEAYRKRTRRLGVLLGTVFTGMPYPANEPKSGWTGALSPMAAINVAESEATGRLSTRLFQTFEAGKIGQLGAPGSGEPDMRAAPKASAAAPVTAAASATLAIVRPRMAA